MQDQYGLFLEAGKEERVGVLSNLLGLGIYGIMEDLAKDELGNLKRDIAKKRQTINIHSATIESYGKPEDEKTEIELKLNTVSEDRNNLAKQKEDKSLLLRMQREAQERHDKVQASVNTLMQKNEQEGQNIAALERNIESCNAFLADEEETNLKVERHDLLLEQDREYAKAAIAYMGKHEELVRIHDQEMSEESFKRFMQSIEKHDYVITIISDNYLKSRNCMFEMLEVVKDSYFSKKLLFIVLGDDDAKYYKNIPQEGISADVYSALGQAKYSKYWSSVDKELEIEIEEIGDPMHAILQIKEKQIVQKILLDMPEFLEFIRDNKGLTLSEHIEKGFEDMISFMGL